MRTPGRLRLADRDYFSLDTLGKLSEAGVFWITQLKVDCSLFDDAETPFCLLKWLKTQTTHLRNTSRCWENKAYPSALGGSKTFRTGDPKTHQGDQISRKNH